MSTPQEKTALDYLTALYGRCDGGDIVLTDGPNKISKVFKTSQLEQAAKHIESSQPDLYIKVNPMDYEKMLQRSQYAVGGADDVKLVIGMHLDVDANKNDKYLTRESMLATLDNMPHPPSMVVQTNGDVGGFHAYWLLEKPHCIVDKNDRDRIASIAKNWLAELQEQAAKRLETRSEGDSKKVVDHTADLCRLLRPVGSKRKSGNRVQVYRWNVERRYQLSDFELPNRVVAPKQEYKPIEGDSVIEEYLDRSGLDAEKILQRQGYRPFDDKGKWIRPESSSGQYTGEIWIANGVRGFTCKSGGAAPLEPGWYSPENLFVTFEHGGQWTKAAAFCYEQIEAQTPQVDTSHLTSDAKETSKETTKDEQPPTRNAETLLTAYIDRLMAGTFEKLIKFNYALDGIEVFPGGVTCAGAPPGTGKTALAMQAAFEAVEKDPELRVVIANAETSFDGLIRRELARQTSIDSKKIRFGDLTPNQRNQVIEAARELSVRIAQMEFLEEPCNLFQLHRITSGKPGLLIVDYLQKFAPSTMEARLGVNAVMASMRSLAKAGWAVFCLSATSRTKDSNGSSHDHAKMNQASFRESGEIEFNADSLYLLVDRGPIDEQENRRNIQLKCVKNRHGLMESRDLEFSRPTMTFDRADISALVDDFNVFGGADDEG